MNDLCFKLYEYGENRRIFFLHIHLRISHFNMFLWVHHLAEHEAFLNIFTNKIYIFLSKVMNSLNRMSLTFMSLKVDTRPPTGTLFCITWSISEGQALNMLTASHHKHTQSKMRSSTALLAVLAFLTHGETYGSVTLHMFLWLHSDPSCCFGLYSVLILLYFLPSLLLMCSRLTLRWTLS